jgi:hypothetical protein
MNRLFDEIEFKHQLNEVQKNDAALAEEVKALGLDVDALLTFHRKQLKAGLAFSPDELIRFAVKQHKQSRPA